MFKKIFYLCLPLFMAWQAGAQVAPEVDYHQIKMKIGGEFSAYKPNYGSQFLYGIGAYADVDLPRWVGIEVEGRTLSFNKYQNKLRMDTGTGGVRFFMTHRRFTPYVKGAMGFGSIDFPFHGPYSHNTYTFYTITGGVDYRLSHHIYLRGNYEYQSWPDFLGRGLNPQGINIGAAYRIF